MQDFSHHQFNSATFPSNLVFVKYRKTKFDNKKIGIIEFHFKTNY